MRNHSWRYIVLMVLVAVGFARVARSEPFLDVSIGGAVTDNAGVDVHSEFAGRASGEVDFETSFESDVRGGYWFDGLPWLGVGGSISYFEPNAALPGLTRFDRADITVVPFTALLMVRGSLLESRTFPYGQIQPYLNVGPGAFVTHIDEGNADFEDTGVDVGVDVRAGSYVMITPSIGVFGEYRFTHTDPGVTDHHANGFGRVEVDTTLDTHHFLFGASFRF